MVLRVSAVLRVRLTCLTVDTISQETGRLLSTDVACICIGNL
jgi:hypothetical protein